MPMATPEAQREYQRKWVANRRAAYFSDKVCVRCGSSDDLELDHINPDDKAAELRHWHNNAIWSWSQSRREVELAKCQILCKECHKRKTWEDYGRNVEHGTRAMYARRCRCAECRAARAASQRAYRARQRALSGT